MQTAEPTGRFLIRRAGASDADELARFAARTFSEAFGAENTPEDLALYLARAYGPAQQGAELRDPTWTTLLAEEGKSPAGYAQVRTGPAPSCVTGQAPIELFRFYVDSPWQGQGLARRLMEAVDEEAISRGARTLWLGVWERNARGQAFYRKCGFVDVGEKSFLVGTDHQRDRVMARALNSSDAAPPQRSQR
jgi:ribosomal protein S18 acetylase RimI-like enzyme